MELRDCVPCAEISGKLSERVTETRSENLQDALRTSPGDVAGAGHMSWHLIREVNGMEPGGKIDGLIGRAIRGDLGNPVIIKVIEGIMKKPVLQDVLHVTGRTDAGFQTHDVFLAEIAPGALFLGDVEFCDPHRPVRRGEKALPGATHHGFGLFGEFNERLTAYAKQKGLSAVVLSAYTRQHVKFFLRHGYVHDGSALSQMAQAAGVDTGFPMVREVK